MEKTVPPRPGLSNVLISEVPARDGIRSVEISDGVTLQVLVARSMPPNPAELVGSPRMEARGIDVVEHRSRDGCTDPRRLRGTREGQSRLGGALAPTSSECA